MKFSIRDVLWLTVVVALAVCWGLDRLALRQAEQNAHLGAEKAQYTAEIARAEALLQQGKVEIVKAEQREAAP